MVHKSWFFWISMLPDYEDVITHRDISIFAVSMCKSARYFLSIYLQYFILPVLVFLVLAEIWLHCCIASFHEANHLSVKHLAWGKDIKVLNGLRLYFHRHHSEWLIPQVLFISFLRNRWGNCQNYVGQVMFATFGSLWRTRTLIVNSFKE